MNPHEARTYTINNKTASISVNGQKDENTHYQKLKPTKSKTSTINKKKNSIYSSGSIHDLNSASSADEWIDLEDDEDVDSDIEQQNSTKLIASSVIKPGHNAHHMLRTQNFIR